MTHTSIMKRIEERAEIYIKEEHNWHPKPAYKAGAQAMLEELAKCAGVEFDALSADKEAQEHAIGLNMPGERELICLHKFIAGARWQHSQLASVIGALKIENERLKKALLGDCEAEHLKVEAENQRLREALEAIKCEVVFGCEVCRKHERIARKALGKD